MKDYQEALGSLPETLLSLGMISPIILSVLGVLPQILDDGLSSFLSLPDIAVINAIVNGGLVFTLLAMAGIGYKAHSKDPGL